MTDLVSSCRLNILKKLYYLLVWQVKKMMVVENDLKLLSLFDKKINIYE